MDLINNDILALKPAIKSLKSLGSESKMNLRYIDELKALKSEFFRVATNLLDFWSKNLNEFEKCFENCEKILNFLQKIRKLNEKFAKFSFPNEKSKEIFRRSILDFFWLEKKLNLFVRVGN